MKEKIPIPPMSTQNVIAELVRREAQFASASSQLIGAIRQYRARLFQDVVTGKLDVRDVAAQLACDSRPDTPEPLTESLDDPELTDEEELPA